MPDPDPVRSLVTSHTTFAARVADGPLELDVEVLRRGRTMSQVRAEVRNPGQPRGHLTTAGLSVRTLPSTRSDRPSAPALRAGTNATAVTPAPLHP